MTPADYLAAAGLLLGVLVIAGIAIRGAYLRAHPKRRHPLLTTPEEGRRDG